MNEFKISKQNIHDNKPINPNNIIEFTNNLINNDNNEVNSEPTNIFIDSRLLNVNDWNIWENESKINNTYKNDDNDDKNDIKKNETKINPYDTIYTTNIINMAIIPYKYTLIKLPIIIGTVKNTLIDTWIIPKLLNNI
jgi:hypothetical protein